MKNNVLKKNNIKTKVISLITAIALWMYVIVVVDPEEKKVIENIPITITNQKEIENDGLIPYPNDNLYTDITIEGKLSEIQKLNKNNINIYGEVINPVEGKNVVNLRTNISNRVSRELKDNTYVLNLEKIIKKKVDVKIDIPISIKSDIHSIIPEKTEVVVSGPRAIVNEVNYVGTTLQVNNKNDLNDENIELTLTAFTSKGAPLNVKISDKKINVKVLYLVSKEVPINIDYAGNEQNIGSYKISPEKITLLGSNEILQDVNEINTEKLKEADLRGATNKKVKLIIPNNVSVKGDISEVEISKTE
ncbi:YbbR-like domain-containing protein [Peptostreptococcus canis]|uniref:YbbR-like protein n=1 Tax=Peptostreptococcus canis TaxID=1159213 RepID=A0ABR6TI22_9FIRM|nr:CdaR family protein [Peptostreptococcus canis]MBC2575077.1 hypothetical protein [Peptostreptococcus canis]MBP1997749.1 YbbR domain-containing protein [Peptostreptococcus canis]